MSDTPSTQHTPITKDVQLSVDHSLANQAFERAMSGATPRTLTPHEWEQWQQLQETAANDDSSE
jgi:hypothetical protein